MDWKKGKYRIANTKERAEYTFSTFTIKNVGNILNHYQVHYDGHYFLV